MSDHDDILATQPLRDLVDARPSLVVVEQDRSWRLELPPNGVVMIGRTPDCEIQVKDPAASRRHAQLRIDGDRVLLRDLGSHNGTLVNGEPILNERELHAGDVIQICAMSMSFQARRRQVRPAPVDEARFHERLAVELERAVRNRRAVTVVAVRFARDDGTSAREVAALRLAARLRAMDTIAHDGMSGLLVLAPELRADEVRAYATRIVEALATLEPRVGLATYPEDGPDAATIVALAREAMTTAGIGEVVTAPRLVRRLELGATSILVADPAMTRVFALIAKMAAGDLPILIQGETGAGKEAAAAAVHHYSPRTGGPMISINCAAIPEGLVESELFGHERGAFSGAVAAKRGCFEAASGGTLFLDEVGELPLAVQPKLLRALDTRTITPVGSVEERAIDLRIVAATNRDLKADVRAGRFREDLYFRLGGATIAIPPLRDRPRDLTVLARELLDQARTKMGREPVSVSAPAMQRLGQHSWPGNVRELKHAMEYAAAAVEGGEVELWHLPPAIAGDLADTEPVDVLEPAPARTGFRPIADELRELERTRMKQALDACGGVQTQAAALLQMPRRTFVAKLKEYGLRAKA